MRIVHTADWHIGQTLAGHSREREHRGVLGQLARIVEEREADALIVAGDIFDSQNPSGEALGLFYDTLVALNRARPEMTIVITAGNHDAAGRLEAPHRLLGAIRVHVVGNVRRVDGRIDIARHLVALRTATGEVGGQVLAVSYPTAACLPPLARFAGEGSAVVRATADLYEELLAAARPRLGGLPLVVTGHLHVRGAIESEGSERRILVGGEHAVPYGALPEEAHYVALGHLHKAQSVGRPTLRYSGSLLPLSATEQPYRHGVTLVTLGGGAAKAEHIELTRPVPFLRLPETGDVRLDALGDHLNALDLEPDLPLEQRPFLQIRLAGDGLPAGYRAEVDRIAEAFPVRLVDVRLPPPAARADGNGGDDGPPVRLTELAPEELFRRAFERAHQEPPEAAHLEVFHRAVAEV